MLHQTMVKKQPTLASAVEANDDFIHDAELKYATLEPRKPGGAPKFEKLE